MTRQSVNLPAKIDKYLTLLLDVLITICFTAILLLTILQVFLRYGFGSALLGGNEAMEGLFIYTTAIGAALAVRRKQHIAIDFLIDLFPRTARIIAQTINLLLVAALNGVVVYYSFPWIQKVGSNESPVMRVPEWIFQICIPIGSGLVILYCLYGILLLLTDKSGANMEDYRC